MVVLGKQASWTPGENAALIGKGYGADLREIEPRRRPGSLPARASVDSDCSSGTVGGGDSGHAHLRAPAPRALARQSPADPYGSGVKQQEPRKSVPRQTRSSSIPKLPTSGAGAAKTAAAKDGATATGRRPRGPASKASLPTGAVIAPASSVELVSETATAATSTDNMYLHNAQPQASFPTGALIPPASLVEFGNEPPTAATSTDNIYLHSAHPQVPEALQLQFDEFSRQLHAHCDRFVEEQEHAVATLLVQAAQLPPLTPVKPSATPGSILVQPPRAMMEGPSARAAPAGSYDEEKGASMLQPRAPIMVVTRSQASKEAKVKSIEASKYDPTAHHLRRNLERDLARRQTLSEKFHQQADSAKVGAAVLKFFAKAMQWWEELEEPPRSGVLCRIVEDYKFTVMCTVAIGLNAIFIVYTTDYEMSNVEDPPTPAMVYIETAFMSFFTIELLLKFIVHRLYLFCQTDMVWNIFDLLLVGISVAEACVVAYVQSSGESRRKGLNVAYLRSMRIFKLAKVLRVVRSLRFFSELRVMVDCVVGSLLSLFWCLVLMFFIIYIFALLIMQGITQAIVAGELNDENRAPVDQMFGTVGRSMFTLLRVTTNGGDWGSVAEVLHDASTWLMVVFTFYILFFCIAAWNVITSTFLDKALKLSRPDSEALMMEDKMRDIRDGEVLMKIFNEIDRDGSESLSLEEFQKISEHPKFRAFLHTRGIDISDAALFYNLLTSSGNIELDPRTFVNACLRMKGPATSIDLHSLHFETKMLTRTQAHFASQTLATLSQLQAQLLELAVPRTWRSSDGSEGVAPRTSKRRD